MIVDQFEMPITKDIEVDVCSIQLVGPTIVASIFGGLMYKIFISRLDLAAIIGVFVVSLITCFDD